MTYFYIIQQSHHEKGMVGWALPSIYDLQLKKIQPYEQQVTDREPLRYIEYDFGDGWEHKVVLEKILPFDPKIQLPQCLKGKGACPPEDVGGVWGYQEFLTAIKDGNHPEHRSYTEWIGGHFDSAVFDLEEVNQLLPETGKQ